MGFAELVAILLAAGVSAGAVGWWCRASTLVWNCVDGVATTGAPGAGGAGCDGGRRFSPATWPLATAAGGSAVAGALAANNRGVAAPAEVTSMVVWVCQLTVLGLIDRERFVVPTSLVRGATLLTGCLLAATSAASGDWHYFWGGAGCALAAAAVFGTWALISPQGLGFGDVRLACLAALGAGALSPATTIVALACAPFVAGLSARYRGRRANGLVPVALGPFLALGAILAVVTSAF